MNLRTENKSYKQILSSKKQIDDEFLSFFASNPPPEALKSFISENYHSLLTSLLTFRNYSKIIDSSDDFYETSHVFADAAIEAVLAKIDKYGTLDFAGQSAFSTYLMGFVRSKFHDKNRITYPSEVKAEGQLGQVIFYNLIVKREKPSDIFKKIKGDHKISQGEFNRICSICRKHDNGKYRKTESFDGFIASQGNYEPLIDHKSAEDRALEKMTHDDHRDLVKDVLDYVDRQLSDKEKALLKSTVLAEHLGGEAMQTKAAGARLGMQNPQYEMEKTRKKLKQQFAGRMME